MARDAHSSTAHSYFPHCLPSGTPCWSTNLRVRLTHRSTALIYFCRRWRGCVTVRVWSTPSRELRSVRDCWLPAWLWSWKCKSSFQFSTKMWRNDSFSDHRETFVIILSFTGKLGQDSWSMPATSSSTSPEYYLFTLIYLSLTFIETIPLFWFGFVFWRCGSHSLTLDNWTSLCSLGYPCLGCRVLSNLSHHAWLSSLI